MICEHSHSCSKGPRVKGTIPAEKEVIFESLPVCLAVETKLLGLGHCLLANSVSINVTDVRDKGFYSIPVTSILDSDLTFQS